MFFKVNSSESILFELESWSSHIMVGYRYSFSTLYQYNCIVFMWYGKSIHNSSAHVGLPFIVWSECCVFSFLIQRVGFLPLVFNLAHRTPVRSFFSINIKTTLMDTRCIHISTRNIYVMINYVKWPISIWTIICAKQEKQYDGD